MKRFLSKLPIILGALLLMASANGLAADLSQVGSLLPGDPSSFASSSSSSSFAPNPGIERAVQWQNRPDLRGQSISPAFLAASQDETDPFTGLALPTPADPKIAQLLPTSEPELALSSSFQQETGPETGSFPARNPEVPTRIVIPAIQLDAPVVISPAHQEKVGGEEYTQWTVPNQFAAGWQEGSAMLGEIGNLVLNGHHNIYGEVFGRLVDLQSGDRIIMYSDTNAYGYIITNKMILPEAHQDMDVRMDNARWILPSSDERLTLITCWPHTSNTHRLIIIALPDPSTDALQVSK